MQIGRLDVSTKHSPLFVAEIGANHAGQLDNALRLIDAAKEADADFVKFQCYVPSSLVVGEHITCPIGPWKGMNLWQLYNQAHTPYSWFEQLTDHATNQVRIPWFSSVFDVDGIQLLEQLECPAYKIASAEITDIDLINHVAVTGKPVIFSTGMANHTDLIDAIKCVRDYIVLHCVSDYPTALGESQLSTINWLKTFVKYVGISDHTRGVDAAVAATALGATMIEKHLQLKNVIGVDHEFSLSAQQFRDMTHKCREIWHSLHDISRFERGIDVDFPLRRSLRALDNIAAGEAFTRNNVGARRPNGGLSPWRIMEVVEKVAAKTINRGEPILETHLKNPG